MFRFMILEANIHESSCPIKLDSLTFVKGYKAWPTSGFYYRNNSHLLIRRGFVSRICLLRTAKLRITRDYCLAIVFFVFIGPISKDNESCLYLATAYYCSKWSDWLWESIMYGFSVIRLSALLVIYAEVVTRVAGSLEQSRYEVFKYTKCLHRTALSIYEFGFRSSFLGYFTYAWLQQNDVGSSNLESNEMPSIFVYMECFFVKVFSSSNI